MEKEAFIALLKTPPEEYSIEQLNQLESLLGQYPYFQTAWALHLKGLKPLDEAAYDRALKRAAALTSDREVLFEFITADEFTPNQVAENHPAHSKKKDEESEGLLAIPASELEFAPASEATEIQEEVIEEEAIEEAETTLESEEKDELVAEPDWEALGQHQTLEIEEESGAEDTSEEVTAENEEETEALVDKEALEEESALEEETEEEGVAEESGLQWTPASEEEKAFLDLLGQEPLSEEDHLLEESEEEVEEEMKEESTDPLDELADDVPVTTDSQEDILDELLTESAIGLASAVEETEEETPEEIQETEDLLEEDSVEEEAVEEDATEEQETLWYSKALETEDQPSFALSGGSEPLDEVDPATEEEAEDNLIADTTLALGAQNESDLGHNPMFQTDFELENEEDVLEETTETPVAEAGEKRSFSDWLVMTKSTSTKTEEKTPEENAITDTERGRKFELLDRFLETNPRIIPVVSEEITVDIEDSVTVDRKEIMTETLAQLYKEQGKYKKALKGYQVLSLKYPEKSSFFAAQIQELKTLIKEKKKNQ